MTDHASIEPRSFRLLFLSALGAGLLLAVALFWADHVIPAVYSVVGDLVSVAPIVVPGILVAAWVMASGADSHISRAFEARTVRAVFAASLIGAITPVCGVTVLPLMAGLLVAGVPLAPIMAFWLSSPITDPAMLATTAATLGLSFAVGKTLAAFGLGIFGGAVTALFARRVWVHNALRENGLARQLSAARCGEAQSFDPYVWKTPGRRQSFASMGNNPTDPDLSDPGICCGICPQRDADTGLACGLCRGGPMVGDPRGRLRRRTSLR